MGMMRGLFGTDRRRAQYLLIAFIVPLVGLLFQAPIGRAPLLFAGLLVTGTLGFAARSAPPYHLLSTFPRSTCP